ncbi:hypothetical protein AK88_04697 [Plasmodium fragile]|uniref:Plasmodium RESA N-terminal domain-containing protein n=1 Tax=Plasmodium fragile TaxID=5857 RepID=A0A0D9QIY2_PLAFR|nr:uncharacterized protein AK88_04697 [Plasmodium fragile]KJP85666.1 hypothetical protein AK88_04697 [Plasmodium fragile]
MNLNKINSSSLLSGKKLSHSNKTDAGENVYHLSSNGKKINAKGNLLSFIFSRRTIIAIGAILCVILQNTCTFENTKNSQLELTARFSRKLFQNSSNRTGVMSIVSSVLNVLWALSPLIYASAVTQENAYSKKRKVNMKMANIEELRERCLDNEKVLDEYELAVMLNYLTQPGCFSKMYALGTWWQGCSREKIELEYFYMQLSRLCKETAKICNYSMKLSGILLSEAKEDSKQRARTLEYTYSQKIYDIVNQKDKSPEAYEDNVHKYRNEQESLRQQIWDEWEKKFYEKMSGEPFHKDIAETSEES